MYMCVDMYIYIYIYICIRHHPRAAVAVPLGPARGHRVVKGACELITYQQIVVNRN